MEQISTENIIASGRRTRGRNIDFAKAAAEMPVEDDEDEDEDDDFEAPEEDEEMKHQIREAYEDFKQWLDCFTWEILTWEH